MRLYFTPPPYSFTWQIFLPVIKIRSVANYGSNIPSTNNKFRRQFRNVPGSIMLVRPENMIKNQNFIFRHIFHSPSVSYQIFLFRPIVLFCFENLIFRNFSLFQNALQQHINLFCCIVVDNDYRHVHLKSLLFNQSFF